MNLARVHNHVLWFETADGQVQGWDPETEDQPPIDTHPYACARFPLEVRTQIYRRRYEDGQYGESDRIATANSSANAELVMVMANTVCSGCSYSKERCDRARKNGARACCPDCRHPGVGLHRAIIIAAEACERCLNALAFTYGLEWGYAELSAEWKRCGTSCEMCEDMGFSGTKRLKGGVMGRENDPGTLTNLKRGRDDFGTQSHIPAVTTNIDLDEAERRDHEEHFGQEGQQDHGQNDAEGQVHTEQTGDGGPAATDGGADGGGNSPGADAVQPDPAKP